MATETTTTPTPSALSQDWSWLKTHLVLLAVVGVLVVVSVYGVESIIARHDEATSNKWNQILAAQTAQTQTLQKQLQADEANWAQVEAQLLAQNAQLTKEVATRDQQLVTQVKSDATLSLQQAAARIAEQTQAQPGEVTAQTNDVAIDLPISRIITADLDRLPVAEQDLANTQTQLANETTIATNAQSDAADAKKVIADQTVQLADANKACQAQITTVKAQARKGKIKAFFIGVGVVLLGIAGHSI